MDVAGAPDLQPVRRREPQPCDREEPASANNLNQLESFRAPRKEPHPADLLIVAWRDPQQRVQPNPRWVGVVICYGSSRNTLPGPL